MVLIQEASYINSPEITQPAITDHLASNVSSLTVTQGESVCACVCVCVGGGGGTLSFFFIRRIGPSIYRLPPKNIGNIKHPRKYLKVLPRKNILILYIYLKKKNQKYIEKTPQTSPILTHTQPPPPPPPKKISIKSSCPQTYEYF